MTTSANRSMFRRLLRRLLFANRGRLFVILLALSAGAAVSAALLNLQGYCWQGNDPSQLREVTLVAKASQVSLDPIMPRDQRSGTREADGAVGSDQRSAGKSREGLHHE